MHPTLRLFPCILAAAVLLAARPLRAQEVHGALMERGSGTPLRGTLVALLDEGGARAQVVLTDSAGRFVLRAPAPGRYRVRTEPIGYVSTHTDLLALAAGAVETVRLEAVPAPIVLEGLTVRGERRCSVRPRDGVLAARVWEQARRALDATAWTSDQRKFLMTLARFERELEPYDLGVVGQRTRTESNYTSSPYVSAPLEELATHGYVRNDPEGASFFAPDAQVLLSERFLDDHCFRVVRGTGEAQGMVGLAFEPLPSRTLPDIAGVLWLDARSSELRYLEFGYTRLLLTGPRHHVGGRVEFRRLPGGAWIVGRWYLRIPQVRQEPARPRRGPPRPQQVEGLREVGGEVLVVRDPGGGAPLVLRGALLTGTVVDSVHGAPLPNARVMLMGTGLTAVTDEQGRWELAGVPAGRHQLTFAHPLLTILGVPAPALRMTTRVGETASVTLATPSAATLLRAACPSVDPQATGLVFGLVADSAARPVAGATVMLTWEVPEESTPDLETSGWRRQPTGPEGSYRICGVPRDRVVTIQLEGVETREGPRRTRLDHRPVQEHSFVVPTVPTREPPR